MLSAVVRLLGLVIKKVPHPVLISRYSQVTGVLQTVLSRHAASANVSLLRGLLGCISVLLRVQPAAAWQLPQTSHDLATLLSFTAHQKPKLRKAGQHAVVSVVRGSNPDLVPHPAASQAAAHCQAVISQSGPTENTVLYMLTMLRDILPALNKTATKSACETVLKLLTLGSSVLVSTGLSALHGLFSGRPASSCLPPEMNSQLVTALYEYQPGINDGAPLVAWLAVQQEGILNLAQNNPDLAHGHLLRFAQTCLSCLLSDRAEAVKATGLALKAVLGEAGRDMEANVAAKLTKALGEGLCYQYHAAWPVLLPVLQTLVEVPKHIICSYDQRCFNIGFLAPGLALPGWDVWLTGIRLADSLKVKQFPTKNFHGNNMLSCIKETLQMLLTTCYYAHLPATTIAHWQQHTLG